MIDSSGFWQKLTSKDSYKRVSDFDLFYQLIYMSAIASSGISRRRIMQLGSEVPRPPAQYFERVQLLAEKLGYDYASACTMVGEEANSDEMKSLLLRFAGALNSGQPEMDFLSEEAMVQGEAYEKEYERDLGALTKWTDAYAAIVVSAALIIIINLTSTLIYSLDATMVVGLVITAVLTASVGAWILSRAAPREVRVIYSPEGTGAQRLVRKLVRVIPVVTLVVCLPLLLLGVGLGRVLILAGLLLFPLGMASMLAGREIGKKDREFGPFLRSLGARAVSTGTTITMALAGTDLSSFPTLRPDLERLHWRLEASIDPELCWRKFAHETGSKLIGETVAIFNDAVKLGADPDTVALLTSQFAAKTIMLRAKRSVVASTFSWLTQVMHGALAMLMIVIMEVIRAFTGLIGAAMTPESGKAIQTMALPISSFSGPQLQILQHITTGMVLLLVVINAFAIIATDGGHKLKIALYLSTMLFLSGVCFLIAPSLVRAMM